MTEIEEGSAANNGLAEKIGADTTWNLSGKSSVFRRNQASANAEPADSVDPDRNFDSVTSCPI
jgi:hypothetical protein